MGWLFKWNLFSSTFTRCYLHLSINFKKMKFWIFLNFDFRRSWEWKHYAYSTMVIQAFWDDFHSMFEHYVQKLSYQKNTWSTVTFWEQIRRTYVIVAFTPKLTPWEKIGFEVIHVSIKKTLHVSSKQNGARF